MTRQERFHDDSACVRRVSLVLSFPDKVLTEKGVLKERRQLRACSLRHEADYRWLRGPVADVTKGSEQVPKVEGVGNYFIFNSHLPSRGNPFLG